MIKSIILDMDGVISNTQIFHAEVESKLLKKYGIFMTPEDITNTYSGVSDKEMFKEIFTKHQVNTEKLSDLIDEKWSMMKRAADGRIKAIPYAIELITLLKKEGFQLAIASASLLSFIDLVITTLHIKNKFTAIVSSQEVPFGKPAPDIFLLAAHRLDKKPSDCIVIEDGKSGMVGAKCAGMKCIGLVASNKIKMPATICVTSLQQINANMIRNI